MKSVMMRLLVVLLVVSFVTSTCPPCPGPPVHACCKPDLQVEGTCCEVQLYYNNAVLLLRERKRTLRQLGSLKLHIGDDVYLG